jgi:hemerythrin-like metal-binding protein
MTAQQVSQRPAEPNDAMLSNGAINLPKIERVEWMTVFETGNRELDAWHRMLIGECNKLLQLVTSDAEWPRIIAAAEEFVAVCAEHFRVEEEILEQLDFPRRDIHVAEHRRIEGELLALIWQLQNPAAAREQCRDLPRWLAPALIDLMVRYDTDFRSHLLERQSR